MKELKEFFRALPSGTIETGEALDRLISLLAAAWNGIPGTDQEATYAYKLSRMERVKWDGNVLEFTLERHGPTVRGSSRAKLHRWTIEFDPPHASVTDAGSRVVRTVSEKWSPDEIVSELTLAILNGKEHPNLVWVDNGNVRIIDEESLVPGDYQRTREGRMDRFRVALTKRLTDIGWERSCLLWFSRSSSDSSSK